MEQKPVVQEKMKIIVWGVRIVAILVILFLLFTVIGDVLNPAPDATVSAKDYFFFFLWAVFAVGLILGFKDEFLGGAIGTGAVLVHILILLFGGGLTTGNMSIWLIFLAPGLLYFLVWQLKKRIA